MMGTLGTTGLMAAPHLKPLPSFTQESDVNIVGPKAGYTPQIRDHSFYDELDANGNIVSSERYEHIGLRLPC